MSTPSRLRRSFGRRLLPTCSILAIAISATAIAETEASAQEIQLTGPLAGAPAVRKLRLHHEGRFEIAPSFTATILDEYRRTLLVGARLNYGVRDWLGVGVWGAFGAVGVSTGLTDQIDQGAHRDGLTLMNVPGKQGEGAFQKQAAQLSWIAMPQVTATPFRGKFALFQAVFADVDAYIFAGAGAVGTKERRDCADFISCAKDHELTSKTRFAPTWGLGFNFYVNNFVGLGLEWRMVPFAWNRSGFDSRGVGQDGEPAATGKFPDQKIDSSDATYRFNQMLSVFLGFSFPTAPKITD